MLRSEGASRCRLPRDNLACFFAPRICVLALTGVCVVNMSAERVTNKPVPFLVNIPMATLLVPRISRTSRPAKLSEHPAAHEFIFLALVLLSLPVVSHAQTPLQSIPTARRFAVLIGISEYEDRRLPRLLGPVNDVQTMRVVLSQSGGFPESNITTITSEAATRRNIVATLVKLAKEIPPDSLLIFAYSGYAFEKNGRGYLLPSDGVASKLLDETGISLDFLVDLFKSTSAARVVVLFDTSFQHLDSAPEYGTTVSAPGIVSSSFETPKPSQCTAVYYPSDVTYEDLGSKQGLFTRAVVEGLKGSARGSSGEITARSLAAYLEDALPKESQTSRGFQTRAQSQIFCGGDFVISDFQTAPTTLSPITYYVSALLHPSAELPTKVTQSFKVDDSGDCSVKQTRSATFCLDADAAVKIGDFKVIKSDCGSKPLAGTISGACITVDYLLQGCGSPGPSCSRAWVAFDIPAEGVKYVRSYLPPFEAPRLKISAPETSPSFQYQGTIPPDARNVKWEYTAEVLRIVNNEVIGDVRLTNVVPSVAGVKSFISTDGRLVVDVSNVLEKWSHETN